jgi:hypothetical protein
MNRSRLTGQRLFAIFLLGCALLNFPLLSLFDRPGDFIGVSTLYGYLFVTWLLLIALMALVVEGRGERR